jgi:hypothetical protein
MRKTIALAASALLAFGLVGPAGAAAEGDFSPEIEFALSDTKVNANPKVTVKVAQEDGEEELAHVTLGIPKGFKLPADEDIPNNTTLGSGTININAGPACRPDAAGQIPLKAKLTLPATLKELDRNDEQKNYGFHAMWQLDIQGVTKINLAVTGSEKAGWKLDGDIPDNANTCPAFSFELTINEKAGSVPIITNPAKAGKKVFTAQFISQDSPAIVDLKQVVKITK